MSRRLKVSSAQLGPIHRADSRASVVKRMMEMLKEADSRGSKFVVFPELALTTFFPTWFVIVPCTRATVCVVPAAAPLPVGSWQLAVGSDVQLTVGKFQRLRYSAENWKVKGFMG